MSNQKLIYHCYSPTLSAGGGIKTYVDSLLCHRLPNVSDRVITSLKDIDQSQFELLHFHGSDLLADFRGECPAIYSLHNHRLYCPSGTKYLADRKSCCDRKMSYMGCTWGHLVDNCGSRRPQKIIRGLQRSDSELNLIKKSNVPVITNSDYLRSQLIKNGLSPKQTVTLRYGIEMPKTVTKPLNREVHQNQRILFAGRIVPYKGLDCLLKALAQTEPQIHLDIAGDGWDLPRMQKLAKQLRLDNRITWHGWCSPEQLESLYQNCFALIFPSVWPEPAGIITLEAYAHYRPVIASAVGGIPEHVRHGETGILVPANNIAKLAAAIDQLSRDYEKSRHLGEQGHDWLMEAFTMEFHLKGLQEIYQQTIENFRN